MKNKERAQKIDLEMCERVKRAFNRLGMTYAALADDSGISSRTQLIDTANGKIDPSKRILRYLCDKGFSAHWLFTGNGPELFTGTAAPAAKGIIVRQLKNDLRATTAALDECATRIQELRRTLRDITAGRK